MIRYLLIFFSLMFLFVAEVGFAAPYRRLVNFEWDAIEGATSYEIELQQAKEKGDGKIFKFKTSTAAWNGRLSAGKYIMKLRSHDYRGVPGEWSAPSDFNVGLEAVVLKSPLPQTQINSKDELTEEVNFDWAPVGGADSYRFELTSEDGKTSVHENIKDTSFKTKIPVAMNYTWKVSATNTEGLESDAVAVSQFSILGKVLNSPKLQKPETEFVREVKWDHPVHTTNYDVFLFKYSIENKKWEKFKTMENVQGDTLSFDPAWPGGKYQIAVRAKSSLRPSSTLSKETFKVHSGDRSPAAEYVTLVRSSIERMSGWYAIGSYLITEMKFAGSNPEKNSTVAYSAVGGTARFGLGWFNPNTPWGFLSIIDMSGFTFKGSTRTFASVEMNAIYKKPVGDRGEARFQIGPYYKELPETVGDIFSGASQDFTISAAGPHLGAEYWYSLTPKFGIQVNAHIYTSLLKVSTPNGEPLTPTLSTQFGFLGSYRFTNSLTGLAGYARREDKLSYKAVPSSSNFASPGDVNESTIVGNYLNLFAEWSF